MTNANVEMAAPGSPQTSDVARWHHRGYVDACDREPFPKDYDTMEEADQRNYEIGRQLHAMIVGRGHEAPVWNPRERSGQMLQRALGVDEGRSIAHELSAFVKHDAMRSHSESRYCQWSSTVAAQSGRVRRRRDVPNRRIRG